MNKKQFTRNNFKTWKSQSHYLRAYRETWELRHNPLFQGYTCIYTMEKNLSRVVPLLYITFKERTISCRRNYLFGYLDVHYFQINKESTCKGVPIWIHCYILLPKGGQSPAKETNPLSQGCPYLEVPLLYMRGQHRILPSVLIRSSTDGSYSCVFWLKAWARESEQAMLTYYRISWQVAH